MKLHIMSDLHLESGRYNPLDTINVNKANVLILAGDITVSNHLLPYKADPNTYRWTIEFFASICRQYDKVLYILGNHEFYKSDISEAVAELRHTFRYTDNLCILDDDFIDIEGIRFIGSTLWTNFNKGNPLSIQASKLHMNDYKMIGNKNKKTIYKYEHKKICPEYLLNLHNISRARIEEILNNTESQVVVISHHAPSIKSIHERYLGQTLINDSYYSDLEDLIISNPKISLWVHGHVHNSFDYRIGNTRVICNPMGYRAAHNSEFNPQLVINI